MSFALFTGCEADLGGDYPTPLTWRNDSPHSLRVTVSGKTKEIEGYGDYTYMLDRSRPHPFSTQLLAPAGMGFSSDYYRVVRTTSGRVIWNAEEGEWRYAVRNVDGRSPWDQ